MRIFKSLFVAGLLLNCYISSAQITITSNDIASLNDTIRISVNTSLSGFQPALTGAAYTWDYSFLVPDSQRVIKDVSPATTPYPFPYTLTASYGIYNYTPDQFPFVLIGSPPTNVYDFYKKTANSLSAVGQGLTVAGNAIPAVYSTFDRIYKFPLHYQDLDSTTSGFGAPLPGFGYYQKKQKRVNEVDGWGTLVTPYGTFNTLRVKSTLTITDSIYLDTIGFGFTIPRPLQYEYKWLAAGKKIPILEIDATDNFVGGLTIDRVNWRDSMMSNMSVNLTDLSSCPNTPEGSLTAHANGGRYPLHYQWSTGDTTQTISNLYPGLYTVTVTDRYGRVVSKTDSISIRTDSTCSMQISFVADSSCVMTQDGSMTASLSNGRSPLSYLWNTGATTQTITHLNPGTYTVTITDVYGNVFQASDSIVARPDSTCAMLISFTSTSTCPMSKDGSLSATVINGRNPLIYTWGNGETGSAISGLSPGSYMLTVTDTFGRQVIATGTVDGNFQDQNCLNIPNAFTPDGDGVNDVWNIRSLKEFDQCKVEILNQWGSLVFRSTGYGTPWDGKYNNDPVPPGVYYYIIELNSTSGKYTGTVTIVK